MTAILLLGGYGYTGKFLAKHILAQTDAHIILAGRSLEKAAAFAHELNDPRVDVRRVDASNPADLRSALQGVTLCLVAAPVTRSMPDVIRACIDARVDYLDLQYSTKKLSALYAAQTEIQEAGLCFVTEAGYHPGLPSALIRHAASKLDTVESALTGGYLNMSHLPYTEAVDELMEAFIDYQAQVYRNGAWTRPAAWEMRTFTFGDGIGKRTCYSMFFEELRDIPKLLPSVRETGFYISGSNWLTDLIITPLVFIGLKLAPQHGIRPLGKLMWWGMGQSRPPYLVALKVVARGSRSGEPAEVHIQISHPDGYELTAIPVAAYLKQYLDGSARRAGVHMLGHLADPVRLFEDMQRMGARIS